MALVGDDFYIANSAGIVRVPYTSGATTITARPTTVLDLPVPDYMTAVVDGGFYGWPFSDYGAHVDTRVAPQQPDLVAKALVPDYALGAHTASLGLASASGTELGAAFSHRMFVGQHGSWNRTPRSGYKVIFVPFTSGTPAGAPVDVPSGFVRENGDGMGRPVGVAVARSGGLLVADDIGNTVWLVSAQPGPTQR